MKEVSRITNARTRCLQVNKGFSLLELVLGLIVVSLILIPMASLMSQVLDIQNQHRERNELMQLAQGKMAEHQMITRSNFTDQIVQGSFLNEGHPELRFRVDASQNSADGGTPNRLLAIAVTAWHDLDDNRIQDQNETSVRLWSKVSRAK